MKPSEILQQTEFVQPEVQQAEEQMAQNSVRDYISSIKQARQNIKLRKASEQQANRINNSLNMYESGFNTQNEELKKKYDVAARGGILAGMIVEHGKSKGVEISGTDAKIIDTYLEGSPERGEDFYNFTHSDQDEEEFAIQMGWQSAEPEEKKGKSLKSTLELAGLGATAVGLGGAALNLGGRGMQWGGRQLYNIPIDKTMKESNKLISAGANIKDAEVDVKDAKQALNEAKAVGEGVEEAEQTLATAEENLKNAKTKGKSIRTIGDTAMEYDIGKGVTEGWTAQSRGIQARHEANQIFKKTIAPALESSKATINVQELINGLADDIKEIAKNDPDKLEAYNEALNSLKESYKGKEYSKYSLKDSQTLKSGLQGRTPQKFWKGQEITNEVQELKGLLSNKLKNAVHSELTKELGEDSAKLYLDWANLDEYAKNMAKQATNSGLKGGFGNFWSSTFHNLTDGAFAKGGLLLDKVGNALEKATNPKVWVDKATTIIKDIKSNPKLLLKGLKAINPVDLIMPDGFELVKGANQDEKLKEWVDKNWGGDITEDERYGLIGKDGYDLMTDDGAYNSLEEKGWTPEGIITLLDSIE